MHSHQLRVISCFLYLMSSGRVVTRTWCQGSRRPGEEQGAEKSPSIPTLVPVVLTQRRWNLSEVPWQVKNGISCSIAVWKKIIFICVCICVCVCTGVGVYTGGSTQVWMCVQMGSCWWQCVCTHTCGGQRSNLGSFLVCHPCCFVIRVSCWPRARQLSEAGWPVSTRDLPAYISLGLEVHCTQVCLFRVYLIFIYVHMSVYMNVCAGGLGGQLELQAFVSC